MCVYKKVIAEKSVRIYNTRTDFGSDVTLMSSFYFVPMTCVKIKNIATVRRVKPMV